MNRTRIAVPILLLFAAGLAVAVWMFAHGGARDAGLVATDRAPLPPFHALDVSGVADITLVQGGAEGVTVEMPARERRRLRVRVDHGVLHVGYATSRSWWDRLAGAPARTPKLRIDFRTLNMVDASGGLKLVADRVTTDRLALHVSGAATLKIDALETQQLTVEGSGAVKAELAGHATRQSIRISGAGDYRAADLASEQAQVEVSGAGRVVVNATHTLDVSLSGAGSVEYVGDPKVTHEVSGVGRVKRRQSNVPRDTAIAAAHR